MRRGKGLIFSLVFLLSVLLVPFAHADDQTDSHARIVRLSYVEGQVQIAHPQGNGYENATMNIPLVEGDQIRTATDGWAEVQFEDGSTIRLSPETQISFTALGRFSGGGTISEISLDQGEAEFEVRAHDDSHFRVDVAQRVIELKHTGRFRLISDNSNPLDLTVWKGEVAVLNSDNDQQVSVKKNETFVLDPADVSHYDLEKEAQADDLDQWSIDRDNYLSSYTSGHNSDLLPYQYGLADLNYYGQYYDIPGYGYCWQPYGVAFGWNPFLNGYWNYVPGFGYEWISGYPWGWMPYRYGQWTFINGYGWVWQPGLWNRWAPVPRVVNGPAGFKPPAPPPAVASSTKPTGDAMKADGSPARRIMPSTATTAVGGKNDRVVITNEHIPTISIHDGQDVNSKTVNSEPRFNHQATIPPTNSTQSTDRFHATPPVVTRPMTHSGPPSGMPPEPRREAIAPPHVSAPAPAYNPSSPPPTMSAPRSFSPPPSPPPSMHESSGGGRPHR